MKFIVLYVEKCSDKKQEFDTRPEAEKFIMEFLAEPHDDNWIKAVFYGVELEWKVKIKGPKND